MRQMPYWRLSSFYLFYFATLGALIPYWSLYLQQQGFSVVAIGQLMAILMATKMIAPVLWGWLADHTGKRLQLVQWASSLGAASFVGVWFAEGFWSLAAVMVMFSFFWNASLPQFEVLTLNYLGAHLDRYTKVRVWGSIGFILSVVALGLLLESHAVSLLPYSVFVLMIGIWMCAKLMPGTTQTLMHRPTESLCKVLLRPEVIALLLVCLLIQASHGPYYAFYTLYMGQYGYSPAAIGQLWGLGVLAEVLIFLAMARLVAALGLRNIFHISLFLSALRWYLVGYFPTQVWIQMIAQILHAATFGAYHVVAIQLIHQFFTGNLQGRGQALYSGLSFGAGGALGSYYSGYVWQNVEPTMIYKVASVLSLCALVIAYRWIKPRHYALLGR